MSLVLYGGGILDKRGSVSGNTFSRSKFGATCRAKTSPINIRNAATTTNRSLLQSISGSWGKDLTEGQRQSFNAFALLNPQTNVFGQSAYLSGHQWFVKLNTNLNNTGGAAITSPPISGTTAAPLTVTVTAIHDPSGTLQVAWTEPSVPVTTVLQVFATPNVPPGVSFVNNKLRLVGYTPYNGSPTVFTINWYIAFKGIPLMQGMKIFVLVRNIDTATGAPSAGLFGSCIIS